MANLQSIARPYALAAFEYARDKQQLPAWKDFLESASFIASQPAIQKLIVNPEVSSTSLFDCFHDLLTNRSNTECNNFLLLLAQNNRLNALPEITTAFNTYVATLEKISEVRVITAVEIGDSFRKKLSLALEKRIQREVTLQCDIDPSIIGGAIIQIGDKVIDGSIRGKISRLLESLTG